MSGRLLIISGPSGVGKGTVISELLKTVPQLGLTVSATTRAPRQGEVDGQSYHFLTRDDFLSRRDRGAFAECFEVHGNWYGTLRSEIDVPIQEGRDVLLEIDTQGARRMRSEYPGVKSVFIAPPDEETLIQRLKGRRTDSEAAIAKRLETAVLEMNAKNEYDYVVTNHSISQTVSEIVEILTLN